MGVKQTRTARERSPCARTLEDFFARHGRGSQQGLHTQCVNTPRNTLQHERTLRELPQHRPLDRRDSQSSRRPSRKRCECQNSDTCQTGVRALIALTPPTPLSVHLTSCTAPPRAGPSPGQAVFSPVSAQLFAKPGGVELRRSLGRRSEPTQRGALSRSRL